MLEGETINTFRDQSLSLDQIAIKGNPLEPACVTRLFHNITEEWITLLWRDNATSEARQLTSTPGHVMLTPDDRWPRLQQMIAPDRQGSIRALSSAVMESEDPELLATLTGAQHYRPLGSVLLVGEADDTTRAQSHYVRHSANAPAPCIALAWQAKLILAASHG